MEDIKFIDDEERELAESIERDEWIPVKNQAEEIEKLREAARNTFAKTERMNIRISKRDLDGIKLKAIEEGLPYQSLVSSIIHKYVEGKLKAA